MDSEWILNPTGFWMDLMDSDWILKGFRWWILIGFLSDSQCSLKGYWVLIGFFLDSEWIITGF